MVTCKCGKTIERVPDWFQAVNVEFVCNNCPNRKQRASAFFTTEASPELPNMAIGEGVEELEEEDEIDM